jgi:hypothetical protein
LSDEMDINEQLRAAEEAEERRQFSKKEAERIERDAQTPKVNPLNEEHLRETPRQAQNRVESEQPTDREKMLASYKAMQDKKQQGLRNKILVAHLGMRVKIHLRFRQGPLIEGHLTAFDQEMGMLLIEGPANSKNSIIGVQLKDVVRWEVFPD